jgi:hypothetical protein
MHVILLFAAFATAKTSLPSTEIRPCKVVMPRPNPLSPPPALIIYRDGTFIRVQNALAPEVEAIVDCSSADAYPNKNRPATRLIPGRTPKTSSTP